MRDVQLIEDAVIRDTFVSGVHKIEKLTGGNVRIWYYCERHDDDGQIERVLVAKLIRPLASLIDAMNMFMEAARADETVQ